MSFVGMVGKILVASWLEMQKATACSATGKPTVLEPTQITTKEVNSGMISL